MKRKVVFNAPVVLSFVGICFVAILLNYLSGGNSNKMIFITYHSSLKSPLTYIRFLTHVFGHADWEHFVGNMAYILLLGPILEEKYSSKILLKIIAVTALATGVINFIVFPNVALCGASGIVFSFILLASFTNFSEGEIPLTFILVAVFFIGQQVIPGINQHDNISNMAHIVGGIIGGLTGYELNKKSSFAK